MPETSWTVPPVWLEHDKWQEEAQEATTGETKLFQIVIFLIASFCRLKYHYFRLTSCSMLFIFVLFDPNDEPCGKSWRA